MLLAFAAATAAHAAPEKYWGAYEPAIQAEEAKNYALAFSRWKDFYEKYKGKTALAERAAASIADMYFRGEGMAPDFSQAALWYGRAAVRADESDAAQTLGYMYYVGLGVPQDFTEAAKWLERSARRGGRDAALLLGAMYRDGQGVARNEATASYWLKRGAGAPLGPAWWLDYYRRLNYASRISAEEVRRVQATPGGYTPAGYGTGPAPGAAAATATSSSAPPATPPRGAGDPARRDLTGAELEQACARQEPCAGRLSACKSAGAQAACYIASACVKKCFAEYAPNNPHRAEWLQGAAEDLKNASALQSNVPYSFDFGRPPPQRAADPAPPPPAPAVPCRGAEAGGSCAGAAR